MNAAQSRSITPGTAYLRTLHDDREVYFHRNSVLKGAVDRLAVGTEVGFDTKTGMRVRKREACESSAGRLRRKLGAQGAYAATKLFVAM